MNISRHGCLPWDGESKLYVRVIRKPRSDRFEGYVQFNSKSSAINAWVPRCTIVCAVLNAKSQKQARYHCRKQIEIIQFEHNLKQVENAIS